LRFFSRQNTVDARREVVNCEFCVPVDGMYKSDPKGSICPKVRFENSAYGQGLKETLQRVLVFLRIFVAFT